MAAGGGSVSARSLARSVAHRLKYYVDVQRKENCFDSSGLIRDEMESCDWNTSPLRLIEWEHGRPLEHDFAKIKLEASLRMYVGSTEECHQKVRKSPEKQKDVEKFIKEMARDYIPDLKNDGRAKRTQRQSYWQRTPSSLHRAAIPTMSAEEVRRLISSSSKFVVAATSEVFPKVLGTTQGADSTPKRRAARTVPSLDHAGERTLSSTRFHKDEAESCIQERNEEFHTELDQKASEKNGGKKPKTTKKRKKVKCRERPVEMSSDVSRHSYKSNRVLSAMLPKSNNSCSLGTSFPSPYSPPGQNKVFRKGILKNGTSLSCTPLELSESQNIEANSHSKGHLQPLAGHSYRLVEIKRKKSSCTPIGVASKTRLSGSSRPLARQPSLTSRHTPEVTGSSMEVCPVKPTDEELHAQSSAVSEKTGATDKSKVASEGAIPNGQGKKMQDQRNWERQFSRKSEETKRGHQSASERNSESHQVRFQTPQQWYCAMHAEQKHNSDSCSPDNLRQTENTTLATTSVEESGEILAGLQEDHDKEHPLTVARGPSLGYHVCQGEDQNMPVGLTTNESTKADANVGNHDKDHSGKLLNQILSFHGGDAKAVDEPTGQWQINDLIFGDSWDQQVTYIPPALLGAGEISEEEDGSSAPPQVKRCVPRSLGDETSDEEFTISSASRCSSAKSLASQERRNTNAEQKEEEANAGSSVQMCVPNVTKESTVQRGMFEEHSEKLRSSAEEKGTNKDRGPEYLSAARVVYFSHLPMSV
ncbi:uncharacterized protein LOC125430756 isoform X2 [Sphaerodactylus townsendi]|uniref:uncharacterized protein LOC125430756 isoform X2 n=1 Tax=Sphaerodactylus townsendi TaxID=933632 RepID=UPI002025D8F3|nr:uncharacterized protein LOC125430756 isoform X2 [Sphaerodactylus townsendi]